MPRPTRVSFLAEAGCSKPFAVYVVLGVRVCIREVVHELGVCPAAAAAAAVAAAAADAVPVYSKAPE